MTTPLVEAAAKALQPWESLFIPRRMLRNAHLQTLAGNFLPRKAVLPPAEDELVEVEAAKGELPCSRVLCQSHWQVDAARGTVLLVHGLEGSSHSQYVRGNAARFHAAGWNVVRMNMRNCGGTERESPTLYHSGLSGDVLAVMRHYQQTRDAQAWSLVGYSMGGNLVLKLAGELGSAAKPLLRAVVGVSPAIDLGPSADALHEPANRVYEWKFLRGLLRRYARKCQLFPQIYDPERSRGIRTLREFDDRITAPYSGFAGADDYYYRAASARVVGNIAVPALILHALDDPFVCMLPETRTTLSANPCTHLVETEFGGHCAFLAPAAGYDGYWAERLLYDFLQAESEGCLMETDWGVEAGGEDPVIEAGWEDAGTGVAWIDLRVDTQTRILRIATLPEVAAFPPLADALALLNAPEGLLVTTKCDHWALSEEERADLADVLDAPVAPHGYGTYIDAMMAHPLPMADFLLHEEWARITVRRCAALELDDVQFDLVIRPARLQSGNDILWGYGLTVYHYAAGEDAQRAKAVCAAAMQQTIPMLVAAADTMFAPANETVNLP